MRNPENRRRRLAEWFENRSIPEKEKSYISQLIGGHASFGEKAATRLEHLFGMGDGYLDMQSGSVALASSDQEGTQKINYYSAKGSCGGGTHNNDDEPKGQLIKEDGFFKKYQVKPENLAAIYADGDSMSDFIVDGDMVLFDITKKDPQSGKIFAIEYPDGLRIKQLRRKIDGAWLLESRNDDKKAYPDEEIPPGQAELLKIFGRFVYRQGG